MIKSTKSKVDFGQIHNLRKLLLDIYKHVYIWYHCGIFGYTDMLR